MNLSVRRCVVLGVALLAAAGSGGDLAAQPKGKGNTRTVADKSPSRSTDAVVLEVGREKITLQQIADAYKKNANRGGRSFYDLPADSAVEFVNLYANYRLKVQEALSAGIDQRPEVLKDLHDNRLQLAVPPAPNVGYLLERKVVDPAVERIFKRRDEELLLSLIYISMRQNEPADTARAYQKAVTILQKVQGGADFGQMARDSSDDPSTKDRMGRLPSYITAGMILPGIEEAGYETQQGKIYPGIVRVPGGYVLLKVMHRSQRYKIRAAHILIANPGGGQGGATQAALESKANAALQRIRSGEDFAKVAREVSDDRVSAENGGDFMSWYTRSLGFEAKNAKLDPEVEETLFKLKDGEVSDIVFTPAYGYHILKRLESRRPTLDEERETIRQFYKQRLIAEDRDAYLRSVVEKHGLKIDEATFGEVLSAVNRGATTADTAWAAGIGPGLRRQNLFSYDGKSYTVGAWIDTIAARPDLRATPLSHAGARNSIYTIFEYPALVEESKNLEQEYPEFAELMREFRDGILIFNLEDEMVWKKMNEGYDEALGRAYFEKNRAKYVTQPQLALTEIFLFKEEDANSVYQQAIAGGAVPFDTMAAQLTQRQGYRERAGKWSLATARNADIVKQVLDRAPDAKAGTILKPFAYQGGWSVIRVDEAQKSRPMSYEEAKSEVQGDYIDYRQKEITREWLNALRLKYQVKIDERAVKSALAAK